MKPRGLSFSVSLPVTLALELALAAADCNRNGQDDAVDLSTGASRDCNHNRSPDECDVLPAPIGFLPAERYPGTALPTETRLSASATGDFTADGHADLIVATQGSSSNDSSGVYLLANSGNGSFSSPENVFLTRGAHALLSADLNGDERLDIAIGHFDPPNGTQGGLTVLLQRGDREFEALPRLIAHNFAETVLAGDLNNDGRVDLVTLGYRSVLVLLNTGDEAFSERVFSLERSTFAALGDLDGDQISDLVVGGGSTNDYSYSILIGKGDGTFLPEKIHHDGIGRFLLADLNGDRLADLVNQRNKALFNQGGGSFGPPVVLDPREEWRTYSAFDVDSDLDTDLIGKTFFGGVSIHLNDGQGRFPAPLDFTPLECLFHVVEAANVDNDPTVDLVALDECNEVNVLRGISPGAPIAPDADRNQIPDSCEEDCNRNGIPDGMDLEQAGDCNRNGIPDDCDLNPTLGFDEVVCFEPSKTLGLSDLDIADLEGRGALDLILAVYEPDTDVDPRPNVVVSAGRVLVFRDAGDAGSFNRVQDIDLGRMPESTAALDFDADDDLDLAILIWGLRTCEFNPEILEPVQREIVLFRNEGGILTEAASVCVGPNAVHVQAADFDGDGLPDLLYVVGMNRDGVDHVSVTVRLNEGGTFGPPLSFPGGWGVSIADLDRDRFPDLVVSTTTEGVHVALNDGSGSFLALNPVSTGRVLGVEDLDGDLDMDILVTNYPRLSLAVLANRGDGRFEEKTFHSDLEEAFAWNSPSSLLADLDGDEDVDLAVSSYTRMFVHRNDGTGSFGRSSQVAAAGWPISAADFDGDSKLDLALGGACPDRLFGILRNSTLAPASIDPDRSGVPDECEQRRGLQAPGDATQDGTLNLTDPIWFLGYLFQGTRTRLPCEDGAAGALGAGDLALLDANGDGGLNLSDAVFLLNYLFRGGPSHVLGWECLAVQGCPEACKT